eukprot:scaffold47671_cov27-Tisochrysis_lutea.AAC.3
MKTAEAVIATLRFSGRARRRWVACESGGERGAGSADSAPAQDPPRSALREGRRARVRAAADGGGVRTDSR